MGIYNLYKKGRYGFFHCTAFYFTSFKEAVKYYEKEFSYNRFKNNEVGKCVIIKNN